MIRRLFQPVDKRRHAVNLLLDDISFDAQSVRNQEQRDLAIKEEKKEKLTTPGVERNSRIRAEIEERGIEEHQSV